MNAPETSVLIRTFNEEKHLPALLASLGEQEYKDFEIVLVDSGSLDRTREIAEPIVQKLLRIKSQDFTFGYSLNVGCEASEGRFIAIVSAHTLPVDDKWLGKLVEPLRHENTAMSYGRQVGVASSKYSEIQDLGRMFGKRSKVLRPPDYYANNANSAVRKQLWQQHIFDETLPGLEDAEWAKYWMGKGYQVVYEPDAPLYHIHEENWQQVKRRYYREALAAKWIGAKSPKTAIKEAAREVLYTIFDFGKLFTPLPSADAPRKRDLGMSSEILKFRIHKGLGTVQGLLDGAVMQDPESRDAMYFDRSCRAVVVRGPRRASLATIQLPDIKPGEVLIRTAYCGVTDRDSIIPEASGGNRHLSGQSYPFVPGLEMSGRVVSTGPNVINVQDGDPVVVEPMQSCGSCENCLNGDSTNCIDRTYLGRRGNTGGYAELIVVPWRSAHIIPVNLDLKKAALGAPMAMAIKGINRLTNSWSSAPEVKNCAVVGAGTIGHLAAKLLENLGHSVTVFDKNKDRLKLFDGSGIATSETSEALSGFDAIVEATGNAVELDTVLHRSPPGATILLLGIPYGTREFTFESIAAYDKTVVGSIGSASQDFIHAIPLLSELDLSAFMTRVIPLEDFDLGWEETRQEKHLKVLLKLDDNLP